MSRVDYCVTTMDRPHALERLLLSVAARDPEASVHVADQSESVEPTYYEGLAERLQGAGLRRRPTIHRLPFDCGVSAARNHLADSTPAEYKLILDDDFVFGECTDIDALVRLLDAHPEAGAVGGCVTRNGVVRNIGTRLEKRGASLRQLEAKGPLDEDAEIRFGQADCVPMFALMRGELFEHVRWDPELKTAGEHFDFFLRMRETPFVVLHTPDVTIDHPPTEARTTYKQLRWRSEFMERMLAKHGLTRLRTVDGTVLERGPDGQLNRYREPGGAARVNG